MTTQKPDQTAATMMEKEISIAEFLKVIHRLPADPAVENPRVWYKTQKEHWLGWLGEYEGPGAYGRKTSVKRTAKFAYNHVVCSGLLLYLIRAIPLRQELIDAAEKASLGGSTLMAKSGAIRKVVPWSEIYQSLWANEKPSFLERFKLGLSTTIRNARE